MSSRVRVIGGVVAVAAALFLFPASAFAAWNMTQLPNGNWFVQTSVAVPAGQAVVVEAAYDYKGGEEWSGTYDPLVWSSYNKPVRTMFTAANGMGYWLGAEVAPVAGYKLQLVAVKVDGGYVAAFAMRNDRINSSTSIVGTVPVSLESVVPTSVPVSVVDGSLSSSGSLDSSGPVSVVLDPVASFGDVYGYVVALLAFVGVAIGYVMYRRWRR